MDVEPLGPGAGVDAKQPQGRPDRVPMVAAA